MNQHYSVTLANENNRDEWDAYVSTHPDASPYHLFAWKKAVEESYGHKGYYLLAKDNDDNIVGILPLVHMQFPFLVSELTALPFCDVGNIICNNKTVSNMLLAESIALCKSLNIDRMNLRGNIDVPALFSDLFHTEKHQKVRMLLHLPGSSEALLKGFKSKLRSQIKKAEKNGLFFFWGNGHEIDAYYYVFSTNMRDLGSPVHAKKWFQSILKHYGNNAKLGLAAFGNHIVGGCIVLTSGAKASIPWASTLRKFNHLAPNMLLYWNVLKYSSDAGFTTFDFGRSSEGEGTYKFKKQWGAEPVPLNWYTNKPTRSPDYGQENSTLNSRELISEIWRRFPQPVANIIGPRIRKYISL